MKPVHSDQKYIEALSNNDTDLIEEIYQKCGPEVRNFIIKNNGTAEDAKDIFQETLATVLLKTRKDKLELTVPLGGYLYFIYRSKWFNKLSKNKKEHVIIEDLKRYSNETTANQSEEANLLEQRLNVLKSCFAELSEQCQNILNAKYKKSLKAVEVMELMQFPSTGAVNKKMFDCRLNLHKLFMKHPSYRDLNL